MRTYTISRLAPSIGVAAALLAGCGGATVPANMSAQPAARSNALQGCSARISGFARCGVAIERRPPSNLPSGLSPQDLQSAYDLTRSAKSKGTGQIVAVIDAYDNPNVASDLAGYRSEFGLPAANFTKYNQEGQTGNYPQGSPAWGVEIDLDVEMVSASCPNCSIYLIEANSNLVSDIDAATAEAVTLGAHIVSLSAAGLSQSDQSYFDTRGVEYVASAGDSVPSYPADFDSVVAVGATVLSEDQGTKRGWSEEIWPDGGVGGCVTGVRKPRWQRDSYCKQYRLANDVAANAFGVAEYDTYDEGGWVRVDGTSVSTPLLAGIFGLAGNATEQDGGRTFWQPGHDKYLYAITKGGGSGCVFLYKRKYNTCTGWGTPHGIGAF
ncbi:MAG TPA: S8 family serine peptidase [Candidatus Cybelea sp.]